VSVQRAVRSARRIHRWARRTSRRCRVLVAGPGVDGELGEGTVLARISELHGDHVATLDAAHVRPVGDVFAWHPSEGSGLLAAAAQGVRGNVEVRDAGDLIPLTDNTPTMFAVDTYKSTAASLATALASTSTFEDAADIIRQITGISEIDYETAKARQRKEKPSHTQTPPTSPPSTSMLPPRRRDEPTTSASAASPNLLA
jgi:hypothetical protein